MEVPIPSISGAHLDEAFGHVADLGLARGVLDHGLALGESGRHQHGVSGADGNLGKDHARALEALGCLGHHVAAVDVDLGAQRLEPHQMQVDRTRADGAAAGHGHARLPAARQQRAQHPEARAHAVDHLVGRGGVDDVARREVEGLAQIGRGIGALAVDREVDPVVAQYARQSDDVGEVGNVLERQALGREQAGDHQRQGGVLGAGDGERAGEASCRRRC